MSFMLECSHLMLCKFYRLVGQSCDCVRINQDSDNNSFSGRLIPINRTLLPHIARHTIGVVAVGARRYIEWLGVLRRSVFLFMNIMVILPTSTPIFF
jgi:hypothetical protein